MTASVNVKKEWWLHVSIMIIATVFAYTKIFNAGFMSWDDMDYVFQTKDIQSISWEHICNWFSTYYIGNYQPLPVATYAIDFLLGAQQPLVYHIDSLIWHIADVLLLYTFINKIQSNKMVGFIVALLFALHPTQTESISWIAARNKVMNGFFFFSAMIMYVDYVRNNDRKKLVWVCIAGFAAYLCKATAVALPLALFAIDIWLQRSLKDKKVWLEKLPLILLAIPIAIMTLNAQKQVNFLEVHHEFHWYDRVAFGGYAYVQYILQLLCPLKLSVLYPYPKATELIHVLYTVIALCIVGSMIVAYKKKWYVLRGGLIFFSVNILPVLQFVQFGEVLMADRYLYIASIGIWFPIVYYMFTYLEARSKRILAISISIGVLGIFTLMTFVRNDIWLSEMNFWEAIVEKFPNSSVAQNSMGGVYLKKGDYGQAMQYIDAAIAEDPDNYKAWYNKGVAYLRQSMPVAAVQAFNKSISINEYSKALFSRAMANEIMHKPEPALADIEKVLQQQPDNARAYYIKGSCLEQMNNIPEAINSYTMAIERESGEPLYFLKRGVLNAKTNRNNEAISDLDRAIQMEPRIGEAWYWRGIAKANVNQNPCADLNESRRRGYRDAEEAILKFCKN